MNTPEELLRLLIWRHLWTPNASLYRRLPKGKPTRRAVFADLRILEESGVLESERRGNRIWWRIAS